MNSFVRGTPRYSLLGVAAAREPSACLQGSSCRFRYWSILIRAVYRRYGLDKILIALQRSGTFLIDKQGIVRYIHQVSNPQASVEKDELMQEVEQLYQVEHRP